MSGERFDAETLLQACLLSEIRDQCVWAFYHFARMEENIAESKSSPPPSDTDSAARWLLCRSLVYAEAQAFLTCVAIVDGVIEGGVPPPRGIERHSGETRRSLRQRLDLADDFKMPGRRQRNGLIHIAERIIPWSKPGRMRGDFYTGDIRTVPRNLAEQTLRALDFDTLRLAVLGDDCDLREVRRSLERVFAGTSRAQDAIGKELDSQERM